jgi:tetratricopeptide (TPR) repeat protein
VIFALLSAALLLAPVPPTPADNLRQARAMVEGGRLDEAERVLVRSLKAEPRDGAAHRLLGQVYQSQHRPAQACAEYETALRIDPQDREARDRLANARRQRGPTAFIALGEWEADSSAPGGWQAEVAYAGLDRMEFRAGLTHADRYYYTRDKKYATARRFFSPTGYLKLSAGKKTYDFPLETNPIPDSNSYRDVPAIEIEVGDDLSQLAAGLRGTLTYEHFRPNFFYAQDSHASNHRVSGELSWQPGSGPFRLRVLAAVLRDPDPEGTVIDREAGQLVALEYGWQALLGGGVDLSGDRISGQFLLIPNPDLDRSQSYAVVAGIWGTLRRPIEGRADYIYGKYSEESVFAGQKAHVWTWTLRWRARSHLELSAGYKVARRPVRDASGPFLTVQLWP